MHIQIRALAFVLMTVSGSLAAVAQDEVELKSAISKHAGPLEKSGKVCGFVVGAIQNANSSVIGFGHRSLKRDDNPDGETIYEIGSVTKGFLTTIFADMILDGTVKPDEFLRDVLPDNVHVKSYKGVDREHPIQLEHLALHTAYLNDFPDDITPQLKNYNRKKIYAYLGRYPAIVQPGAVFDYSNYGASVLGLALEERSGIGYRKLFQERIFDKLDMQRTGFRPIDQKTDNAALPYSAELKLANTFPDSDIANLCGGIRTTGNDMMKFARACVDHRNVLHKSIRLAVQPRIGSYARGGKLEFLRGYSWYYVQSEGIVTVQHAGDTFGYSSILIFDTQSRRSVFILCNTRAGQLIYQTALNVYHELGGIEKNPMTFDKK